MGIVQVSARMAATVESISARPSASGTALLPLLNLPADRIETSLQAPDPLKEAGIDQGRNRFAIAFDHDAVVAILHLIEHVTQVLPEGNGAGFADHRFGTAWTY
jgi:hypothetical protein